MVKKYYQDEKDRRDESRAMKRKNKMDDSYMGMLSEDHSAPANLPQEVKHTYYPKLKYFEGYYLDDTLNGIDDNSNDSVRKIERNQSESMY